MGKIIISICLLVFSVLVFAQEQQAVPPTQTQMEQQQIQQQKEYEAGSWVGDWWENVVEVQTEATLNKEDADRCEQKLGRYRRKVDEKPDSEYYKMKLEKWTKRCTTPAK